MTDWLILFSNIAAGSVRTIIGLFLIYRLLATQKPGRNRVIIAADGIIVISAILSVTGLSDFYRMVLEIAWITVCSSYRISQQIGKPFSRGVYFQNADTRLSLFVSIFYEIAISLCQFLVAAWSGVIFHLSAFPDYGTAYGQISVWLFHALLIAGALYIWKKPNMTGKEAYRFASIIVVTAFIAVVTLSQQTILPIADDTLDMWTILSLVIMMSVLIFNMNRQYEVEKELARLKTEQAELLERDYTTLNNAYAINAKLFHDFHNHIGLLRQLLSHAKSEEAMQYLDELQTPVQEMTETVWTGDETVDYMINSKAVTAKERNVQYQAQVEFPRHTNLRSVDLCAVLGNLLDNALEAAGQVPEKEERFIRLTIRRINQMIIIKVENSFHNPPVSQNGVFTTSKVKNGLHGWGLKSAQTAAEKYDGTVQTSYKDNVFKAVATLSYQCVSGIQ